MLNCICLFLFTGYGHLDTFLGKKSHLDIYPKLVQWLDKYADDHDVKDKGLKTLIFGALDQSDEHTNVQSMIHYFPCKTNECSHNSKLGLPKARKAGTIASFILRKQAAFIFISTVLPLFPYYGDVSLPWSTEGILAATV